MSKWGRISGVEVVADESKDESSGMEAQIDKTEMEAARSEGDN